MYLTSDTGAYFNDIESIGLHIGVCPDFEGTNENCEPIQALQWDKSSLEFIGIEQEQKIATKVLSSAEAQICPRVIAYIQNGKDSRPMEGSVKYEVYWIESGNPKNGEKVAEGEVPKLDSGETFNILYEPMKSGIFMVKAYQRPDHPGTGQLWSEEIVIGDCSETSGGDEDNVPPAEVNIEEQHTTNTITLTWSNPTDTDFSYVNVYRSGESAPIKSQIIDGKYVVENLEPSTEYTFKITTVDSTNNESQGVTITVMTSEQPVEVIDQTPPNEVSNLVGNRTKGASGKILLTWSNPTDSDFNKVELYLVKEDGTNELLKEGNILDFEAKNDDSAKTFKVITVDTDNNKSTGTTITVE